VGVDQRQDGFAAFVAEHDQELRGTALLLTGDAAAADDLLVAALARTHRRWRRLGAPAAALADTNDALVSATLGRTRLPATGRDSVLAAEREDHPDHRWLAALAGLHPRTRAVAVLRLHEGQDEDDVAALLGCSPAEVGAALADALAALAPLLAGDPVEPGEPAQPVEPVAVPQPPPVAAPDPPATPGPTTDAADPYAIYRRPGSPAPILVQRPAPAAAPAPTPAPLAVRPQPGDDPNAIYRRPT
jgi:DNA-directed RNA polymerase specialized sigma24 family protein